MVWRIIRFLAGAGIAGGGGYLVWTHRGEAQALYPFVLDAAPWYLIAGLALLVVGMVTVVSSLLPGVSAQKKAEKAARRDAHLREADSFYAERARAVERDWRSGDLPPESVPAQPDAPAPATEPVAARSAPVAELAPAAAPQTPRPEKAAPLPPPAPPPPPSASAVAPAPSTQPAPSSAPGQPFPALATLAPIPAARSIPDALPPHLTRPASAPQAEAAPQPAPPVMQPAPEPPPVAPPPAPEATTAPAQPPPPPAPQPAGPQNPLEAIRVAISASRLDEADRLLSSERTRLSSDGSDPLALAELTGLAGDHAAASGRLGGAKWLWRLSLQRFAAANAIASPAARAVSERLRLADQ